MDGHVKDKNINSEIEMIMSDNQPYRLCCDKSRKGGTPPHACFVAKLQKMGI